MICILPSIFIHNNANKIIRECAKRREKETKKTEKFKKSSKMYNIINFENIRYK